MYPKRFQRLSPRTQPVRHVIIHSTKCRCSFPSLQVDDTDFQGSDIVISNVALDGEVDFIYHYVVDRIDDDWYVIVGRPLQYAYDGFDLGSPYDYGIHICLVGDWNVYKPPNNRVYEVLAYRVLTPVTWMYRIPLSNIMLHSDIKPETKCPGTFFDKGYLLNVFKKYRRG